MPELNVDLIQRVMKRIEQDPTQWDQADWGRVHYESDLWKHLEIDFVKLGDFDRRMALLNEGVLVANSANLCGTAFCFAGHTILEAGDTMLVDTEEDMATYCRTPDGRVLTIDDRAQELLGLDADQALTLFGGSAGNGDLNEYKDLFNLETGVNFD